MYKLNCIVYTGYILMVLSSDYKLTNKYLLIKHWQFVDRLQLNLRVPITYT